MKSILVVDDNLTNLKYISLQISSHYKVILAKSGPQALQICSRQLPDLILLDINMPEMDGFEMIAKLKSNPQTNNIPVIFLSASHDNETEIKALDSGAMDFITKPFEKSILLHRINLHLRFSSYQLNLENTVKQLEDSIVTSFAEIIDCRDENTGGHVQRTSRYIEVLSYELLGRNCFSNELNESFLEMIIRAAPLHDIGKIGISDTILLKPGKLTDDEFNEMKKHTTIGADILRRIYLRTPTQSYLNWAVKIAEGHHEKYDGSGYPYQLKGESIPLCSRIMAIPDVYDALVSERIYRKALSHEEACRIITTSSGSHFDPVIVEAFDSINEKFLAIASEYLNVK